MVATKRVTRGRIKQDRFVITMLRAQEYVQEHLMTFVGITVGVVVVVAVIFLLLSSGQAKTREAEEILGRGNVEFRGGNFQLAAVEFQNVLDNYGGTDAARLASFYLANSYYALNNYDQAQQYFELYLDKYKYDKMLTANAMSGLAQCYRAKGMMEEAAKKFDETYKKYPDSYVSNDCLYFGAKSYAAAGDYENARRLYNIFDDLAGETNRIQELKQYLVENGALDPTLSPYD